MFSRKEVEAFYNNHRGKASNQTGDQLEVRNNRNSVGYWPVLQYQKYKKTDVQGRGEKKIYGKQGCEEGERMNVRQDGQKPFITTTETKQSDGDWLGFVNNVNSVGVLANYVALGV